MQYGYFDDDTREYVITNPKTPVKWINYIGTLAFGGFVDQTGGALICKQDPALNRILKYIPQLPASDFKGETLYLRFKRAGGFKVFSPFFIPTLDRYDRYECHVGLGYTRIVSQFYGLQTEVAIFVPMGEAREIRDIRVTNVSAEPLEVDAIPVVEYSHPHSLRQYDNADWAPQTMQSRLVEEANGLKTLLQYPFMFRDIRVNYFTSNQPVSSFDSDRPKFLGDNEYGTWANPLSLQQPELTNSQAQRGDNIAALLHHLGTIPPGETRRLITQLGQAASFSAAQPGLTCFRNEAAVDEAFAALACFWDDYLAVMQVETPDAAMNSMLNVHNPRQCHTTKNWSRYLSLYQLGIGGSRGIGFRDSSQDVLSVLASMPDEALDLIRKLLQVQRRNGSAMHQFNPLTMEGSVGDSAELEDRPRYYSDDHLWVVLAVTAYIKETGQAAFLDEVIPYYEKDKQEKPIESGAVLDHLKRALAFTKGNVGVHGLPLLGFADWNDTVNLPAGAESLFTANLYGVALLEMIELARYLGDSAAAEAYGADYQVMKNRVNEHAWDGEWYVRYFDADGSPLGSKTNTYGQIYINSQSWAVLSGFAPADRARLALESLNRRLNTPKGIKISTPGFDGYDPRRGGITTYPPGAKENGGIFLHTNPWVMIAETMLGHGERAYAYYHQINPAARNDRIDEFQCEPYVYPQNILGDEHPQFGLARNSWLSGTASWAYRAATQYILGVRPDYRGLLVDPCIPNGWDGFRIRRKFRNVIYHIEVKNPQHVSKGVKSVRIDGRAVDSPALPIFDDRQTHVVEIVMGS